MLRLCCRPGSIGARLVLEVAEQQAQSLAEAAVSPRVLLEVAQWEQPAAVVAAGEVLAVQELELESG